LYAAWCGTDEDGACVPLNTNQNCGACGRVCSSDILGCACRSGSCRNGLGGAC
jgi:hypothetical protein